LRTSILALALVAAAPVVGFAQSPTWQTDYSAAQKKAADQQRPLAVVFGQGVNGWQQLAGSQAADANRTLADKYVCCYVDTATPEGLALARKFELTVSVGVTLSDRTGNLQAFWHEGTLSADVLAGYLAKYADPQRAVTTTDTNPPIRAISYYPSGSNGFSSSAAPVCRT
jgi:hypothetical protein